MNKTLEKLVGVGLTPRIIAFSIPFSIFWALAFYAVPRQALNFFPTPSIMLLLIVEAAMVNFLGKRFQFTIQEWTVFSTIAMSGLLCGTWYADIWTGGAAGGGFNLTWLMSFQESYYGLARAYIIEGFEFPAAWLPRDPAVLEPFRLGGEMPWAAWGTTLFYLISSNILIYLSNYFFMLVFRKPWIDTERITYPAVQPTYELLVEAKAEEGRTSLAFFNPVKNKIFWVPFILGAFLMFPEAAANYIGIHYLPGIVTEIGQIPIDLSPYLSSILPGLQWDFMYVWVEACGGAAPLWFFAPIDVLKSVLIVYAVYWYILPQVLISTGFATPGMEYSTLPGFPYALLWGTGWGFSWAVNHIYNGFTFGCLVWLFYHYRKQILHTLKSAVAGTPREPEEPHSWRFIWVAFVVTMLAWYGIVLSSGVEPIIFISFLLWLLNYVVINRVWAETGRPYAFLGAEFPSTGALTRDAYRLFGYDVSKPNPTLNFGLLYFDVAKYNSMHVGGHEVTALSTFKIANMTKTDPRSVGWAYIVAIIIGLSFHIPLAIWMSYSHGWAEMFRRIGEFGGLVEWAGGAPYTIGPTTEEAFGVPNYHAWVLVGSIFVFALFWMKSRFSWFWFNPIALGILSGCARVTLPGLLIYFLLKWAILKIGGARAYEKYGLPAVLGLWMGVSFVSVIMRVSWGIMGAAEWMYK